MRPADNPAADAATDWLTPSQACDSFGTANGRPRVPYSTVIRWINEGYRLPTGEVVRLAAERIGERIWIARAHLDAFKSVVSRPVVGPGVAPVETPAARTKRGLAAKDALAKILAR